MPKKILEEDYVKREDVKAVINLFRHEPRLQYSEIREKLGLKKGNLKPYNKEKYLKYKGSYRIINHETQLQRILKKLEEFETLYKYRRERGPSYYFVIPQELLFSLELQDTIKITKSMFFAMRERQKSLEKKYKDCHERNLALIDENARLKNN